MGPPMILNTEHITLIPAGYECCVHAGALPVNELIFKVFCKTGGGVFEGLLCFFLCLAIRVLLFHCLRSSILDSQGMLIPWAGSRTHGSNLGKTGRECGVYLLPQATCITPHPAWPYWRPPPSLSLRPFSCRPMAGRGAHEKRTSARLAVHNTSSFSLLASVSGSTPKRFCVITSLFRSEMVVNRPETSHTIMQSMEISSSDTIPVDVL
jgi:hypothetical protein